MRTLRKPGAFFLPLSSGCAVTLLMMIGCGAACGWTFSLLLLLLLLLLVIFVSFLDCRISCPTLFDIHTISRSLSRHAERTTDPSARRLQYRKDSAIVNLALHCVLFSCRVPNRDSSPSPPVGHFFYARKPHSHHYHQ
nr:MAG TPA: hypothetical protein [Caudoviricetes sp.]